MKEVKKAVADKIAAEEKELYQYADYIYKKGKTEYRLRFYFDDVGFVRMIAYFKNYRRLL